MQDPQNTQTFKWTHAEYIIKVYVQITRTQPITLKQKCTCRPIKEH